MANAAADADIPQDSDGPVEPQLWHQYRMNPGISKAWLDPELTAAHMKAFDDAWDVLVVREEWRTWVRAYARTPSPSLILVVRPGLDVRRIRKTKRGVSMHLPAAEVHEAESSGDLIALYLDVIHAIYSKWAKVSDRPSPPPITS